MAFLEEDGTGLAAANSYGSVADFKTYHKDRGTALPDGTLSSGIEDALVKATDYVDRRWRNRFIGVRDTETQRLRWPRRRARYPDGRLIAEGTLPAELLETIYEFGFIALTTPLSTVPTVDASGALIQETRIKVGPIETETIFSQGAGKVDFRSYPEIEALLVEIIHPGAGAIR